MAWIVFAEACSDSAMGLVLGALFGTMVIMSFTVSYLIETDLGFEGTFWLYSSFNFLCTLYCIFILKETKGLSPLQLKQLYWPKRV